jgi:hypothetical protein
MQGAVEKGWDAFIHVALKEDPFYTGGRVETIVNPSISD